MADIRYINFAKSLCIIDESTLSETGLTCVLERNPTCGLYHPIYYSNFGQIVIDSSLSEIDIPCVVNSMTPENHLFNLLGEEIITIQGANLPYDIEENEISLVFSDDEATKCVPISSSTSELKCKTSRFDTVASLSQTYSIAIVINGHTATHSLTITMQD